MCRRGIVLKLNRCGCEVSARDVSTKSCHSGQGHFAVLATCRDCFVEIPVNDRASFTGSFKCERGAVRPDRVITRHSRERVSERDAVVRIE